MEIWPTDLDYGILGFEFEHPIRGRIKSKAEDFVVTEVDPNTMRAIPRPPKEMYEHGDGGGLYLGARVWKKNIDHAKMEKLLAKTFKVPTNAISTAGIKDKNAITTQLFTVYQPRKVIDPPLQIIEGMEIDGFARYKERMYPGRMGGNSFDITIRETEGLTQEKLDNFAKFLDNGIINYYGYQRFGGYRPITAEFGRLIVKKDYHGAIDLYLGGKSAGYDEIYREMWRDNHDPDELLMNWDNIPAIEREILIYISKKDDYFGAIRKMPEFLINISKSAFISLLFNNYTSRRGMDMELQRGERIIEEKIPSIVNSRMVENIEVAFPSKRWEVPLNDIWADVFDKFNVDVKKELREFKHNSRMLKLYPVDFEGMVLDDETALVSFQLPSGAYATTVLRELMQVIPVKMV